jgi:hypothetical protein
LQKCGFPGAGFADDVEMSFVHGPPHEPWLRLCGTLLGGAWRGLNERTVPLLIVPVRTPVRRLALSAATFLIFPLRGLGLCLHLSRTPEVSVMRER